MNLGYPSIANHNQLSPIMNSSSQPTPIPGQSSANQIPIQGQSDANPWQFLKPIQNQSDPFFANSSQSNTNPVPIWCQSMPILNNSVPFQGQFVTNCQTDAIGPKHKPRRQYRTNLELPLYPQHIKLDWHCIGSALAPIGKSSANPKPFTRPFVPIT